MILTCEDYFGRMSHVAKPTEDVVANAWTLLDRVNALLALCDLPEAREPRVNSGWRSAAYNAGVPGAAARSKHITGQAIDLADPDGMLDDWCFKHPEHLEDNGLWLEHPLATKGWTHLQSVPPRSGNRVFYP